jgi:phosphatidylglycerol:prolipoprotein diacylglycerol transferase
MSTTVSFPGLNDLSFTINNIAFSIFGINIYWYGIIIASGFLLAVFLGMRTAEKYGINPDDVIDMVLIAAPVAIIGARLFYVLFSLGEPNNPYVKDPLKILKVWEGGLAIYGGVIGGLGTAYVFARVKKIKVSRLFDFGVPYFILAQAIGRWGNFVNQEAFGSNTDLPWGMISDKTRRYFIENPQLGMNPDLPVHPTFLYESLWDLSVFFFLIWYRSRRKKLNGEVFCLFMALYGAGRFVIEGLRTDSLMLGNLRISQALGLVFAIVFFISFLVIRKRTDSIDEESAQAEPSIYRGVMEKLKEEEEQDNEISINNDILNTESGEEAISAGAETVENDSTRNEEINMNEEINNK